MTVPIAWPAISGPGQAQARRTTLDTLINSLETLIKQSTEALGPDAPSTLMLKQQLAAVLTKQGKSPKVYWMKAVEFNPGKCETKD